ncbi:MAG TPA: ATP-binding cassette domain-containing protein, partial [Candidatus Acidoferrum sp.]|nr:ATP-binding cassette domain-containing protein [Candidatus Acidoferrum sp.]
MIPGDILDAVTAAGLELRGIRKTYGSLVAVDGLDMAIHPGEVFGFVGSNGAGKTTAMRAILGVLAIDGGEVRWAGEPLTLAVRRQIGYMPEERGL